MLEARSKLQMNQSQLAQFAGVGLTTVLELESMKYTSKDCGERARLVANALDLDVADVMPPEMLGIKIESTVTRIVDADINRLVDFSCRRKMLPAPVDEVANDELHELAKERIETILNILSYREREVIKLRFGIKYENPFTYKEVSQLLKVTIERIRQIERKALARLRQPRHASALLCLCSD